MNVPPERQPSSTADSLGWALVAVQFVLLGMLGLEVARARPSFGLPGPAGVLAGAAAAAGAAVIARASGTLGRRLRAHPAPPADAVLRTEDLYGVVRHPIYLGLLLLGIAGALITSTPRTAISLLALALLLNAKSRIEERLLTKRFPGYAAYAARVPRFVPRFRLRL